MMSPTSSLYRGDIEGHNSPLQGSESRAPCINSGHPGYSPMRGGGVMIIPILQKKD